MDGLIHFHTKFLVSTMTHRRMPVYPLSLVWHSPCLSSLFLAICGRGPYGVNVDGWKRGDLLGIGGSETYPWSIFHCPLWSSWHWAFLGVVEFISIADSVPYFPCAGQSQWGSCGRVSIWGIGALDCHLQEKLGAVTQHLGLSWRTPSLLGLGRRNTFNTWQVWPAGGRDSH